MATLRLIGRGRAGLSLSAALGLAGWDVVEELGRDDDPVGAARGCDVCVLAVPDRAVAEVARSIAPGAATVVHLAGSLGLDVLAPHPRRASLHPLIGLPDPETGAPRLASGIYFAIAGDGWARRMAEDLGGAAVEVGDEARVLYHAAACVAANHLVALLGQVQRLADRAQVPFEAFWPLSAAALEDARRLGPARALTGPVARGDRTTTEAHRRALRAGPEADLAAYDAMTELARLLALEPSCR